MTDQPRDTRYQVSADRESAVRRVRYVETSRGDATDCTLCQLDEGLIATGQAGADAPEDDTAGPDEEEQVRQQLVTAIENQLQVNDPAFVQAVLNKLTLVGVERQDALDMMAYVLAVEIRQSLQQERGFDADNYERMLRGLPELPETGV